jgi:hypothetical protein
MELKRPILDLDVVGAPEPVDPFLADMAEGSYIIAEDGNDGAQAISLHGTASSSTLLIALLSSIEVDGEMAGPSLLRQSALTLIIDKRSVAQAQEKMGDVRTLRYHRHDHTA